MAKKNNKKTNRQKNTFSILLKILLGVFLLLLLLSILKTCRDCDTVNNHKIVEKTGYLPDDEDWDNIPDVVPPYDDDELDSLPDKVSLEAFFPPIGDQGTYGTCVAWATGYNLKTALNAIDNHWSSAQLADPSNQTSPKDLWMGIPSIEKGPYCEGTDFGSAFSVLMTEGVADMQAVPYKSLGNCNGVLKGNSNNKIIGFSRVVSETSQPRIEHLKAYLHDTIPLVFGAKLGDNFMTWSGDRVISSDTYLKPKMQHAYHAMVLSGYDDEKRAFRVRNSWGTSWGDQGSIWVDYDFFVNEFCFAAFVVNNDNNQ